MRSRSRSESFSSGKLVFAVVILAIVLVAIADQCGALEFMLNAVDTGAAGAKIRGMVR